MCDPITLAMQATPSWFFKIHEINGLEIHPRPLAAPGRSVFGQLKDGGLTRLESFNTEKEAGDFVFELTRCWSQLASKRCDVS